MRQKNNNSNKKLNYQIKTKSVLTQHLFVLQVRNTILLEPLTTHFTDTVEMF